MTEKTMLAVKGLCLNFPNFQLRKVTFQVQSGEYFVLLGPTGSGKTLLIESICGLHTPQSGSIHIAGQEVIDLDTSRRNIGYVPQDYALLPFKTVEQNIAFGLEARRLSDAEIAKRVGEMLDLLGIRHLAKRSPGRLSGGERQRVALGRALVIRPSLLLLDEPFSAIDEGLRDELRHEIRQLQRRLGITTIHICHSLEEAVLLGDRMAVIRDGQIVQCGAPKEILSCPVDLFMAKFLRLPNLISGEVKDADGGRAFYVGEKFICQTGIQTGRATAVLPFDNMSISRSMPTDDPYVVILTARIKTRNQKNIRPELRLNMDGTELTIPGIFPEKEWKEGEEIFISLPRNDIHILQGE